MKKLIYLFIFVNLTCYGQLKYITKTGIITFEASVPSFEEVKAKNNSVTAIINSENREFAALVLVKGFRFKNALMEEHFNENYAESDKYPKATVKGKITSDSGGYKLNGSLTFHGKEKRINDVPIKYSEKDKIIEISGNFHLYASDFAIQIPKIVKNKVSEKVNVWFNFSLKSE